MLGEYQIYDSDAHVLLSPCMWESLPAKYNARRPRPVFMGEESELGRYNTGWLWLAIHDLGFYPGTGLLVSVALLKNERPKVKKIVLALLDALQRIRSAKSEVVRYIQKKWQLQSTVADGVYRSFLDLVPEGGKISSSCIKDYLENDVQGKNIPRRADPQSVADFSLLEEIQKGK